MRIPTTLSLVALGFGLAFGFAAPSWAQPEPDLVRQELARDVTPGALLIRESGEVILVSTEEGPKLIGKVGWSGKKLEFGLEASSKLQEGAEEVELLNLDGVAGGATVTGQISYRHHKDRAKDRLSSVCEDFQRLLGCNLYLDRIGDSTGNRRTVAQCDCLPQTRLTSIGPEQCTFETLNDKGFPWDEHADKAQIDAVAAGCAELAKLTDQAELAPAVSQSVANWPFSVESACNEETLVSKAADAKEPWLTRERTKLEEKASKLEVEAENLNKQAKSNPSLEQEFTARAVEACKAANKLRADAVLLEAPVLLNDPQLWLKKEQSKKLKDVCLRYNSPSTEAFLSTKPNDSECDAETVAARAEKLPKPQRSWIRRQILERSNYIPWVFTLRGSVTRQSFSFVETADLDTLIKQSKEATKVGLFVSTLFEGTFYSLGIETERKYQGQPKATLCRPLAGTDAQVCNPAVLGGPTEGESELARLEVRRFVGDDLALAGRALYQLDTDEWEVHSLLYFLRSEKKGLNGGIDLSYDSEDEWNARLFIGTTFSLEG